MTEDALTGMVHDLFSWWPANDLLRDLFARVREFDGQHARLQTGLALPAWDRYDVCAWPSWTVGEPDLVLRLFSGSVCVARVVIEAKFGAAKSNGERDQLDKYHEGASSPGTEVRVVYLTHHPAAPANDLQDSFAALRKRQAGALPRELGWLSWRDVHASLRLTSGAGDAAFGRAAISAADVLANLAMCHFTGTWEGFGSLPPPSVPGSPWYGPGARRYRWILTGSPVSAPPRGYYARAYWSARVPALHSVHTPLFYTRSP